MASDQKWKIDPKKLTYDIPSMEVKYILYPPTTGTHHGLQTETIEICKEWIQKQTSYTTDNIQITNRDLVTSED
jgi:hypothetical protein